MVYQFRITEIVGDVCSSYHWDMIDHNAMCTKLYWIDVSDIDFTLAANHCFEDTQKTIQNHAETLNRKDARINASNLSTRALHSGEVPSSVPQNHDKFYYDLQYIFTYHHGQRLKNSSGSDKAAMGMIQFE